MMVRERIIEQMDKLGEAELLELERDIRERASQVKLKRQLEEEFRLLDELAAPMSDEDRAILEAATQRRLLFGNRRLEIEPDEE